jgi:ABC-2 type transport system permease protein
MTITQAIPLLRASTLMMLRSRGVIYAMVSGPVMVAAFGLMRDLSLGFGTYSVDFFDFVLPGLAFFLATISLQDTMVAIAASYKARGVLTRLAVTLVPPALVVAAQILAYVVLGVVAAVVAMAVGKLVGGNLAITGNLLWLPPLIALGVLTALSISFTIAGLTPNPPTANIAAGTLALPLFTLSGAVPPIEALPGPLPDIVPYAIPFASLIEAIRGIALAGTPVTAYGQQLLIAIGWLAITFTLAVKTYSFDSD